MLETAFNKTKWVWKLIRTRNYFIATDKMAGACIVIPETLEDRTAQVSAYTALLSFREMLDELIAEHEGETPMS